MFDFPSGATKNCFANHTDRALHADICAYCRLWPNLALQRTDAALSEARKTDHSVAQVDENGKVLGVSLPIPQTFISQAVTWRSVTTAVELLFHHHDREVSGGFLARTILPKQVVLLRQKYEDALIYMVVRKAHGHAAILKDHGWTEFDPEFELILSREHTGARYCANDLWFRAPMR